MLTGSGLRRALAACFIAICAPPAASAAEFGETLSLVASRVVTARTLKERCDLRDPAGESARRDALSSWLFRHDVREFDAVMAGLEHRQAGFGQELASNLERARKQIDASLDEDGKPCGDLAAFLAEEKYDIRSAIRSLRRLARNAGIEPRRSTPEPAPPAPVEIAGLARLSVLFEAEMARTGSYEASRRDTNLRRAREAALEAHLERQGAVSGRGRIIADNRLREWRGPRHSRFALRCRSFRDPSQAETMKASMGQDMIVTGRPRSLSDGRVDGEVVLTDCVLSRPAETGGPAAATNDEAGLILRPLDAGEANAGPGKGIRPEDVDSVLYTATFQNRMDGFGNGYTDRREAIYVLLRDGSAYRHRWSFPFTDLDLPLSKEREPERWLRWARGWTGKLRLTAADGEDIDVTGARELVTLPPGTRLDHSYYYMNVGSGGARRDRSFSFRSDGSVEHDRSGFTAGNFAGSYIIVSPGRERPATSTYRFEDFTLIVSGPQGEERHFFAIVKGDDPKAPDEAIINGQVYWTRKGK